MSTASHTRKRPARHSMEMDMQRRERDLVNHNVLAVGAIASILLLVLMFNAAFSARSAATNLAQSPSPADQASSPGAAQGALKDAASPSSLQVPAETGIYLCRTDDLAECSQFCSQVHLQPQRCMIKLSARALDSSLCACSTPE